MIIAVDFDGTIVVENEDSDDANDLELKPDAREGLEALKRAGHILILFSGRANRANRVDWRLNPLWRDGVVPLDVRRWKDNRPIYEARYQAMLDFVAHELPGIFDAIDDGQQGKPSVDMWIDDRSIGRWGYDCGWPDVIELFGERA